MADLVKLDLKKQLKHLYLPSAKEVVEVDVPEMQFAMIQGEIEKGVSPGDSPHFAGSIGALFGLSYTLKFVSKRRPVDPIDYTVMALEGLWTTPGGGADYATSDEWSYTLMIMQPDHITEEMFVEAREKLRAKRAKEGHPTVAVERARLERFKEGRCVQIMHLGPYLDEARTLEKMGAYVQARGYEFHGPHHEIYLGDPRTAKPENLKTVLRHAVRPLG
ncbi:MAG: GyrI-like domain-containing protein [Thermoleophilia bacterium]|nr:GyrI-like domain-containing protein [Thermoleophilia bacterium]